MKKDNLPLGDHSPIIKKKLKIIIIFELGNQDENYFYIEKATIPDNPFVEFRWNGPLQGYTKCYLQKLSK